jgi:pimeloyl-ACP methyl ester carboxylesterase
MVVLIRWATLLGRLRAGDATDLPLNIPLPTMGGQQFWADELFFHQWHIQRNVLTGHYRLLDEQNIRRAWGTLTDCRIALEQVKQEKHLPPMRGRAVILLHGLFSSHTVMNPLANYLHERGGYVAFNVTYPSTQSGVGEHAESLARIIANLDGIEEINFVAYSMGNIVVRNYLAERQRKPDPRLRRMVMLGPPNHGSLAAVVLAENAAFQLLTGEAGQELGAQWSVLETHLATPQFPFGIIAGGKQDARGYNPLLRGDNDGTISVDTTRLAGAADFAVLPVLHQFLPYMPKVQEYTLRFLQHGSFAAAERRRRAVSRSIESPKTGGG